MKRISAWAAILFAPTLVGTIYGMNFQHMPELHWAFGYPLALLMMLLVSLSLYAVFKHRGWSKNCQEMVSRRWTPSSSSVT